ncbi:hypothetical protein FJO69_02280 [[Mycoplasma] falconis]|uniref:Uncharacterized protein n=1 Tax=[Mycoplasma] falconis TaxID=92403 RepID=A0A501X9W1_9BACT|nr:hypothetical protein [[Mycoplasma] falconis]TPE57219.1 hypothetical protein FJO69_02280 [[Mycoplasma] falconis]
MKKNRNILEVNKPWQIVKNYFIMSFVNLIMVSIILTGTLLYDPTSPLSKADLLSFAFILPVIFGVLIAAYMFISSRYKDEIVNIKLQKINFYFLIIYCFILAALLCLGLMLKPLATSLIKGDFEPSKYNQNIDARIYTFNFVLKISASLYTILSLTICGFATALFVLQRKRINKQEIN